MKNILSVFICIFVMIFSVTSFVGCEEDTSENINENVEPNEKAAEEDIESSIQTEPDTDVTEAEIETSAPEEEPNDAEMILGTWKADLDIADEIKNSITPEELEEINEIFSLDTFNITLLITFNDDGTYSMAVDEASVQVTVDEMMKGMEEYIVDTFDAELAESGLTLDMLLALSEMTYEEFMAEMMSEVEEIPAELTSNILASFNFTGKYVVEDGKLFTFDEVLDENNYDNYTLTDSALTLTEHIGEDDTISTYPLEFRK